MKALSLATIDTFRNSVIEADALTLCRSLPPASVDLILTDVPYGSTALSWDVVVPFADMWAAFKRVIKPRGAVVMTAAGMFAHKLAVSNEDWFKYEWVWEKSISTMFIHAKNRPLLAHEHVMVFSSGAILHDGQSDNRMPYYPQKRKSTYYKKIDRKPVGTGGVVGRRKSHKVDVEREYSDRYPNTLLCFGVVDRQNNKHPTQKPVALFAYLIKTYTRPGALVLDPFAGSGTTAVAAKITGRDFICGDITPEYVELARRRVNPEFGKAPKRERQPEPLDKPIVYANGDKQPSLFAKVTANA